MAGRPCFTAVVLVRDDLDVVFFGPDLARQRGVRLGEFARRGAPRHGEETAVLAVLVDVRGVSTPILGRRARRGRSCGTSNEGVEDDDDARVAQGADRDDGRTEGSFDLRGRVELVRACAGARDGADRELVGVGRADHGDGLRVLDQLGSELGDRARAELLGTFASGQGVRLELEREEALLADRVERERVLERAQGPLVGCAPEGQIARVVGDSAVRGKT